MSAVFLEADLKFVKKITRPEPYQILQGNALLSGTIYTAGKKIYTAASRDGRAKFQICLEAFQVPREQKPYSSFKLAHLWKMYRVKNEIML